MQQDLLKVLASHQDGEALLELNNKFTDVVQSVLSTGQKGAITITYNVKPAKVVDGRVTQVETDIAIKTKKADPAVGKGMFYVDPGDGRLTRDNNKRMERELGLYDGIPGQEVR